MAAIPLLFNLDVEISGCISGLVNFEVLEQEITSVRIRIKYGIFFIFQNALQCFEMNFFNC